MLTAEQLAEQESIYDSVGHERYCPLVTSNTAAAELFIFFTLRELRSRQQDGKSPNDPIKFRFAFELASSVSVGHDNSTDAQVKRFVNSFRTAVYRQRARVAAASSNLIRKFQIIYDSYTVYEGPIADRPHIRCATVSLLYVDDRHYNTLAKSPLFSDLMKL